MKLVTAVREGFYDGSLRSEGQSFYVPDDLRSTWFAAENETPLIPDFEVDAAPFEIPEGHQGGIIDMKDEKFRKLKNENIEMKKRLADLEGKMAATLKPEVADVELPKEEESPADVPFKEEKEAPPNQTHPTCLLYTSPSPRD